MKTETEKPSERQYRERQQKVRELIEASQKFNDGPTFDALFEYLNENRRDFGPTSKRLSLQRRLHLIQVLAELSRRAAHVSSWLLDR